MKKNNRFKGFTLIELLVVISIIALLLAILVPALQRAKEQAKSVVCQSRMKQWGIALYSYSAENKGQLPYFARYLPQSKPPNARNVYWYEALAPYISVKEQSGKGHESEAFKAELRTCPASTTQSPIRIGVVFCWDGKTAPFYYGNYPRDFSPFRLSAVKSPAMAMALMDSGGYLGPVEISHWTYNPLDPGMEFVEDWDNDGVKDSMSDYGGHARPYNYGNPKAHYGGCNAALLDGHVERVEFEDLWLEQENRGGGMVPTHEFWELQ